MRLLEPQATDRGPDALRRRRMPVHFEVDFQLQQLPQLHRARDRLWNSFGKPPKAACPIRQTLLPILRLKTAARAFSGRTNKEVRRLLREELWLKISLDYHYLFYPPQPALKGLEEVIVGPQPARCGEGSEGREEVFARRTSADNGWPAALSLAANE
jgi:hypothetical protein